MTDSTVQSASASPSAAAPAVRLGTSIANLPGVGTRRVQQFGRLEIRTVRDLIQHLPMRYEQEMAEGTIRDLPMNGAIGTARGMIVAAKWTPAPGGKGRFQATLQDHSERLYLVWFNASYLRKELNPGMTIRVQGKVKAFNGYPQMTNPKFEILPPAPAQGEGHAPAEAKKVDRLKPIYPSTEGLNSAAIEKVISEVLPVVLPQISDPLPAEYVKTRAMPELREAYRMAHQPAHVEESSAARRRLAFNELLLLQLGIAVKRHYNRTQLAAAPLRWSKAIDEQIRRFIPFALTPGQETVIEEIAADLKCDRPMNRLVQGDVGSGKTVVALYAMLMAVSDRRQAAMMAPTELLAEQHYRSITKMLEGSSVRVELLVGGLPAATRRSLLDKIEQGGVDIVIGTQALIGDKVKFRDLALVVVDEQHRFGVMQRATLRTRGGGTTEKDSDGGDGSRRSADETRVEAGDAAKSGKQQAAGTGLGAEPSRPVAPHAGDPHSTDPSAIHDPQPAIDKVVSPHCLVMTATPIPRTLSLTVFGDLDISTIKGLPPGRSPVITRVVRAEKGDEVYRYMAERLAAGEQAYVVLPLIDASGNDDASELKNVQSHAKLLQDKYCRGFKVAVMHGRLKHDTRDGIMEKFRKGSIHVLVATTVIEVGVDVPNATMMIVEHAERFGLSQLHQFRGRVGRGSKRALCVFIGEPVTEDAARRLAAIAGTNDGFIIAEQDLEIRGTGEIFGTKQHGSMPLRVARIPQDMELLQMAKRDASAFVDGDPLLEDPTHALLRKVLVRDYGDTLGLVDVA